GERAAHERGAPSAARRTGVGGGAVEGACERRRCYPRSTPPPRPARTEASDGAPAHSDPPQPPLTMQPPPSYRSKHSRRRSHPMAGAAQPLGSAPDVRRYPLFINGKFVDSASGKTFESISPHDRSVVAVCAEGDKADIDAAVTAARAAYDGVWSTMLATERAKVLFRMADLLEQRAMELGQLETLDMGGPIFLTSGMAMMAAEVFRYWAGWATKIHGFTSPSLTPGDFVGYTMREPLGVVGGITPWNGPLIMAAWKTAPALACGNAVVLKPAEHTPMTAMELAKIAAEAGLPEGVLNVVPGFGPTAGAALASHPDVDKIAFTGEYVTGRLVVQMSASNLKTVTLELGGKSPHIIFDDVD